MMTAPALRIFRTAAGFFWVTDFIVSIGREIQKTPHAIHKESFVNRIVPD